MSANGLPFELHVSVQSSILPVSAALAGILVAALFYAVRNDRPAAFAKGLGHFYRWAYHKFYVDAIYLFFAKQVMDKGFGGLFSYIDTHVIQGGLSGLADGSYSFSVLSKRMPSWTYPDSMLLLPRRNSSNGHIANHSIHLISGLS